MREGVSRELNEMLGPKRGTGRAAVTPRVNYNNSTDENKSSVGVEVSEEEPKTDLLIDLHNTTSDTGVNLMMAPTDAVSHAIYGFLQ